ncbi:MAG: pitrilysin family protein [Dehalococcoidia bacterium]
MTTSSFPRPEVTPLDAVALPDRQTTTVGNGTPVTLADAGVVPMAAIRLVVRLGSAHVPAGKTWLDRLLHEYLREGTEELDAEAFASALAEIGGQLDIDGDEHSTTLEVEVPSEHAPRAIRYLGDLARRPRFPDASLDRLIDDLRRNAQLIQAQPAWLAHAAFRQALYPHHTYGAILPSIPAINDFTTADARSLWAAGASGSNAHLMVAGVFDSAAVLEAADTALSGWTGNAPSEVPIPAASTSRVIHYVDRPGAEQSTLQIGLNVPAPGHEDYAPLEVVNALLGGSFYSRITLNIREDKGYTYSPRSAISSRPGDAYWAETADVTTNVTGASIREVMHEIDRLRNESPAPEELAGIINYVAGAFAMRQATPGGILNHLEFLDLHHLDRSYSDAYTARVRAVTPDEVQRLAQQYLDPARMPIVVVGDRSVVEAEVSEFGPAT